MILATVRPGPTLHIWKDGKCVLELPLTPNEAMGLCADILREMPRDLIREPEAPKPIQPWDV
jgi:hypothetical protein